MEGCFVPLGCERHLPSPRQAGRMEEVRQKPSPGQTTSKFENDADLHGAVGDRSRQPVGNVAEPPSSRHVVSPLRDNDLTHDDGLIDTIGPAEDRA